MTPDEINQRMTELDAELAAKLRAMGFSETEVARVLDSQIPAEQRDAEIKDILAREFIKQANDPQSEIMAVAVKRVERDALGVLARIQQPRDVQPRRWTIALVTLLIAALLYGVAYIVATQWR